MCRHSDRACVLGSGGARDAVEARMPGRSDTVVRKGGRAVPCVHEGCEDAYGILSTEETYREAALLFDFMAQCGSDPVRLACARTALTAAAAS